MEKKTYDVVMLHHPNNMVNRLRGVTFPFSATILHQNDCSTFNCAKVKGLFSEVPLELRTETRWLINLGIL